MKAEYRTIIAAVLEKAAKYGVRHAGTGAILYGHVLHRAPEAWFHEIYPPLDSNELSQLEESLATTIPPTYREFLTTYSNGITLFSCNLSFDGLRRNYKRDTDSSRQPFDIIRYNVDERPENSKDTYFYIGGYTDDGSLLFLDSSSDFVYRCDRDNASILYNRWNNFSEMLCSEVERISGLFDEFGKELNPDVPTTPPLSY